MVLCFVDFESPAEAATAKDALQGTLVSSITAIIISCCLYTFIDLILESAFYSDIANGASFDSVYELALTPPAN